MWKKSIGLGQLRSLNASRRVIGFIDGSHIQIMIYSLFVSWDSSAVVPQMPRWYIGTISFTAHIDGDKLGLLYNGITNNDE